MQLRRQRQTAAMALIMNYVDLGNGQEGRSLFLLEKDPGSGATIGCMGRGHSGKETEARKQHRMGVGCPGIWWGAWQAHTCEWTELGGPPAHG